MTVTENELVPFTFPDSGRQVLVKKTSPVLIMKLRQQFPPPKPPKQAVDYGEGVGMVMEENTASPTYLQEMQAYEADLEEKVRKLYIKRGVRVKGEDLPMVKELVKELRADWKETTGKELDGPDEYLYVSYICISTDRDLEELIAAVTRTSFRSGEGHSNGNQDNKS